MAQRRDGQITQQKILEAASEAFANRGYAKTKTSEICEAAGVNGAAINYHFRSKEELYREIWRIEIAEQRASNPEEGGVDPDALATDRLHGRIFTLVRRFFNLDGTPTKFGFLLTRELAEPSGLIEDLRRDFLGQQYENTRTLMRELLGDEVGERDLLFVQTSIVHQCLALGLRRSFHSDALDRPERPHPMTTLFGYMQSEDGVIALVDHITRFSLAGIEATRMSAPDTRTPMTPTPKIRKAR